MNLCRSYFVPLSKGVLGHETSRATNTRQITSDLKGSAGGGVFVFRPLSLPSILTRHPLWISQSFWLC